MHILSILRKIATKKVFTFILIAGISFSVYLSNVRYTGSTDSTTNEFFASNIAETGHTYVNEYFKFDFLVQPEELPEHAKNSTEVDGKFYSKYPPATPVLAWPFFKLAHLAGIDNYKIVGKVTAAFLTALSIPVFFFFFRRITSRKRALFITVAYAFASSTWGISSAALWQHTMSQLFSVMTLFMLGLLLTEDSRKKIKVLRGITIDKSRRDLVIFFLIGLLMGVNIAIRPTNAITAALVGLLIISSKDLKKIGSTVIGGVIPVAIFCAYNYKVFGSITGSGYGAEAKAGWTANFIEGFTGLLFSPGVGLLVFSPIFLIAFVGMFAILWRAVKTFKFQFALDNLYLASIPVFVANLLLYSKWWAWHGDSWVYRMIIDAIPYLMLAFVPALDLLIKPGRRSQNFIVKAVTVVLLLFSIYIQVIGAFVLDYSWHSRYKVTYRDNSYLFNWRESRLVYYLLYQRYQIELPHRTIYVPFDKFGSDLSFASRSMHVGGKQRIAHAVALNTGRSPVLAENGLNIDSKYDGLSMYIADEYLDKPIKVMILLDASDGSNEGEFQVRELRDGKQVAITKYKDENKVEFVLDKGAEEIRIQNDDIEDNITIQRITFASE